MKLTVLVVNAETVDIMGVADFPRLFRLAIFAGYR
jgi:hypothetical protein